MAVIFLVDRYVPYNEITFLDWRTRFISQTVKGLKYNEASPPSLLICCFLCFKIVYILPINNFPKSFQVADTLQENAICITTMDICHNPSLGNFIVLCCSDYSPSRAATGGKYKKSAPSRKRRQPVGAMFGRRSACSHFYSPLRLHGGGRLPREETCDRR